MSPATPPWTTSVQQLLWCHCMQTRAIALITSRSRCGTCRTRGHGGEQTRTFVGRDGAHVGQRKLRRRSDIAVVVMAPGDETVLSYTGSTSAKFHGSAVLAVHRLLQVHRLRTGKTTRIRCCPGPADAFCVSVSLSVSLPMSLSAHGSLSALPPPLFLSLSPPPPLSLSLSLSLSLFVCLSVCLSVSLFPLSLRLSLPLCLSVCLSVGQSVFLCLRLSGRTVVCRDRL